MKSGSYVLDVPRLYRRIDEQRQIMDISWRDVAKETGLSPSTFSRMAIGRRPDVDALCTLIVWLGLSLRQFVCKS